MLLPGKLRPTETPTEETALSTARRMSLLEIGFFHEVARSSYQRPTLTEQEEKPGSRV